MNNSGPETWWQTLIKAAVDLWSIHVAAGALDGGAGGALAWWSMIRRWAAALAYRFGRMAIYAENRYNAARA